MLSEVRLGRPWGRFGNFSCQVLQEIRSQGMNRGVTGKFYQVFFGKDGGQNPDFIYARHKSILKLGT